MDGNTSRVYNCTPDAETCDRCGWVDTSKRYHQNISTELLVAAVVDCYLVAVLGTAGETSVVIIIY